MVAAIAMVKDEADIAAATVGHMQGQVDLVLVADNGSTDGTREILEDLGVEIIDDDEVGYFQSQKMTWLAQLAADAGADWVVPFDADEWWYSPFGRIADVLVDQTSAAIAGAFVYDHVAGAEDPAQLDPVKRIGWRRVEPCPLRKVACRPRLPATIAQGNHDASYPPQERIDDLLVVRHFPYRSVEQFVSKVRNGAAAYAATDLPEDQGKHWRDYGRLLDEGGENAIGDVFRAWFWSPAPAEDRTLLFDPCPT